MSFVFLSSVCLFGSVPLSLQETIRNYPSTTGRREETHIEDYLKVAHKLHREETMAKVEAEETTGTAVAFCSRLVFKGSSRGLVALNTEHCEEGAN